MSMSEKAPAVKSVDIQSDLFVCSGWIKSSHFSFSFFIYPSVKQGSCWSLPYLATLNAHGNIVLKSNLPSVLNSASWTYATKMFENWLRVGVGVRELIKEMKIPRNHRDSNLVGLKWDSEWKIFKHSSNVLMQPGLGPTEGQTLLWFLHFHRL